MYPRTTNQRGKNRGVPRVQVHNACAVACHVITKKIQQHTLPHCYREKDFPGRSTVAINRDFDDAQSGSPMLLVRGGEVAKVERLEPREFGGSIETLEKMLLEAVHGPHADWTAADLEDIAKRVREHRRG